MMVKIKNNSDDIHEIIFIQIRKMIYVSTTEYSAIDTYIVRDMARGAVNGYQT